MSLAISSVSFVPGSAADVRTGLLGYVSMTLGGALRLDGVTVRRTAAGRMTLSFPSRRDRRGREHPLIKPLGQAARTEIEGQVLAALTALEVLP